MVNGAQEPAAIVANAEETAVAFAFAAPAQRTAE